MPGARLTAQGVYHDMRIGFGPELCALMDAPGWTDIMINPDDEDIVWVDTDSMRPVTCHYDRNSILGAARLLASYFNVPFNVGEDQVLDAVLPIMGIRANFVSPPAVSNLCCTFRRPSEHVFSLDDLIGFGTITSTQGRYLVDAVNEHKNIVVSGGTGCHLAGTGILMADGTVKRVEDIAVGDRVMGDDSRARIVTELHRGKDMMYAIIPDFRNGEPYVVNSGHILSLKNGHGNTVDIPLSEYLSLSGAERKSYKAYRAGSVSFEGNHGRRDRRPYDEGYSIGERQRLWDSKEKGIPERIRTEHIRDEYKLSDEKSRLELLTGILESAAFYPRYDEIGLIVVSESMAEDIVFIARSLGFSAQCTLVQSRADLRFDDIIPSFRVCISGDIAKRLRFRKRQDFQQYMKKSIRDVLSYHFSVKEIGVFPYYGFECDGNHRYVLSDFTVTHNSGKSSLLNTLITFIDKGERIISIEDVPELRFANQPNHLSSIVNMEFTYNIAIAAALRQRPSRILIGECRYGKQALEMLKAWNTGHPGGMTTIHSNGADEVFRRLDQLCSEVSVSSQMEMIHEAVDTVVQMKRGIGRERKVTELLDVRTGKLID